METALTYLVLLLLVIFGSWLALILVSLATPHVARTASPAALLGSRIGGLAMVLPCFWFAIFLGGPLGGGLIIGIAGDSSMRLGAMLGFAVSFFLGVLLGAAAGAAIGALLHWARHTHGAA